MHIAHHTAHSGHHSAQRSSVPAVCWRPVADIPQGKSLKLVALQTRGQVVMCCGGEAGARAAELMLLAACLRKTSCARQLVLYVHPKIRNLRPRDGSGENYGALRERVLQLLKTRVTPIDE